MSPRRRGELPKPGGRHDPTPGSVVVTPGPGLSVVVLGTPAPQGSKNPGTMTEANWRTGPWRASILAVCKGLPAGWEPLDGPLQVEMWFNFAPPASAKRGDYPATKYTYDVDKLLRAMNDGLSEGGAIVDDARIVDAVVHKRYIWPGDGEPCAVARVTKVRSPA